MEFKNLTVKTKKKYILSNISGHINEGEQLAILGPSGAGKSTLLKALCGRQSLNDGSVLLHGKLFTKVQSQQIAYVPQHDMFFSDLTLEETLWTAGMLQISYKCSPREKQKQIDYVVDLLDLRKCLKTVIGSVEKSGLSGGERKRAAIAWELIKNPDIVLIDEPTSGIDSAFALHLMQILKKYGNKSNKIVVTTIHQPSSEIFQLFDKILLLSSGHVAYFGKADLVLEYFDSLGFRTLTHVNPADFILELVSNERTKCAVLDSTRLQINGSKKDLTDLPATPNTANNTGVELMQYIRNDDHRSTHSALTVKNTTSNDNIITLQNDKWNSNFLVQFCVLLIRCSKLSGRSLLQKVRIVQLVLLTIVTGLGWFQLKDTTDAVREKLGLIYWTVAYWTFASSSVGSFSFTTSQHIIKHERESGLYRLSAYVLAKIISELPLVFILPVVYYSFSYWVAGLAGNARAFLVSVSILILGTAAGQGIGMFAGAAIGRAELAEGLMTSLNVFFFLTGTFLSQKMNPWFQWVQYGNIMYYAYSGMSRMELIYGKVELSRCSIGNSTKFIKDCALSKQIIENVLQGNDIWFDVVILISFILFFRVVVYFTLRLKPQ